MTCKVTIDLTDVSGYAADVGDVIVFEAKNIIGSATVPGRVISTAPSVVELVAGRGEINLEPGPVLIRIKARNYRGANQITATVPDEIESLTFRDLLEDSFVYEPSIVQEAQKYKIQAGQSATEAKTARDAVYAVYGSATAMSDAEQSAKDSAAAAHVTLGKTEDARDEAVTASAAANNSATNSAQSATDAAQSASDASSSAAAADSSATVADNRATAAKTYMDTSWANRSAAIAAKNEAQAAQTGAENARDSATEQATNAAAANTAANTAADRAEQAATNAASNVAEELDDTVTAAQQAREGAETAAASASTDANRAEQAANSAAEVVSSGVPDATTTIKGKLKLSGDLAGTADAPTVPGLAGRVPVTTAVNRIYGTGVNGENYTYPLAGTSAPANSVAYRTTGGVVLVGTPTSDAHAATKKYVDDAAANKVTTNSDQTIGGAKTFSTTPTVGGVPIVLNDDSRLTDTRTPKAHTHSVEEILVPTTNQLGETVQEPLSDILPQILGIIPTIEVVSALPATPDPTTFYFIREV